MESFPQNTPQPPLPYDYAFYYLQRSQQVQSFANTQPTFRPNEKTSSVIVLDDDDENDQIACEKYSAQTFNNRILGNLSVNNIQEITRVPTVDYSNPLDLEDSSDDVQITGVGVLTPPTIECNHPLHFSNLAQQFTGLPTANVNDDVEITGASVLRLPTVEVYNPLNYCDDRITRLPTANVHNLRDVQNGFEKTDATIKVPTANVNGNFNLPQRLPGSPTANINNPRNAQNDAKITCSNVWRVPTVEVNNSRSFVNVAKRILGLPITNSNNFQDDVAVTRVPTAEDAQQSVKITCTSTWRVPTTVGNNSLNCVNVSQRITGLPTANGNYLQDGQDDVEMTRLPTADVNNTLNVNFSTLSTVKNSDSLNEESSGVSITKNSYTNKLSRILNEPRTQPIIRNTQNSEESTDLQITGVEELKEWIDISELNVENHILCEGTRLNIEKVQNRLDNIEKALEEMFKDHTEGNTQVVSSNEVDYHENADPEAEAVEDMDDNWADINVEEEPEEEKEPQNLLRRRKEPNLSKSEEHLLKTTSSEEENDQKELWKVKKRPKPIPSDSDSSSSDQKHKCPSCLYITKWKSNLTKHIITRHKSVSEIKWHKCPHCLYNAKTKEYLRFHLRSNHEEYISWHNCPKCPLKFKLKQSLQHHILAMHSEPNWLKCDQCPFQTKYKRALTDHKRFIHTPHSEICWLKCDACHFQSKTKKGLKMHKKHMHTAFDQLVWYQCDKCNYEGTNKRWLNHHIRKHHSGNDDKQDGGAVETPLEC